MTTTDVTARSVLVVDDDDKLSALLVRSLERAGYSCLSAGSGDQALWAVSAHAPDALVLDVMIPHPSGVEVCRHLRSVGYEGAIVVMSGRSNPQDRAAAERAGADRFLAKPFVLGELSTVVDDIIEGRQRT